MKTSASGSDRAVLDRAWRKACSLLGAFVPLWLSALSLAAPPGDSFEDPLALDGEVAWRWTDFRGATAQAGETSHYSEPGAEPPESWPIPPRSVWFAWRAPRHGIAQVALARKDPLSGALVHPRPNGAPRVAVYTNVAALASLQPVEVETRGRYGHELYRFAAAAQQEFRFALSGAETWDGDYLIGVRLDSSVRPDNDAVAAATLLDAETAVAFFDLDFATREQDEPTFGSTDHLIRNDRGITSTVWSPRGGASIWYRWSAPAAGSYSIRVSAPACYPQVAIHRKKLGSPANLPITVQDLETLTRATNGGFRVSCWQYQVCESCEPQTECHASSYRSHDATVTVNAQSGEEFWIQVDRLWGDLGFWSDVDSGDLAPWGQIKLNATNRSAGFLHIARTAPNDAWDGAPPLPAPDDELGVEFYSGASFEPGEPPVSDPPENHASLWWSWPVPESGSYLAEGPRTEVFRGASLDSLEPLRVASGAFAAPTFEAVAGETLSIRTIVAPADTSAQRRLFPRLYGSPANDRFASAIAIDLGGALIHLAVSPGPLSFESGEPRESALTNSGSAWFSLRPQNDQIIRLSIPYYSAREVSSVADVGAALRLFQGAAPDALQPVAPTEPGFLTQEFSLKAGAEYRLQVQAEAWRWSHTNEYRLRTAPPNDWFAGRIPLPFGNFGESDTYSLRTAERGEPAHAGEPAIRSLWYSWEAPRAGLFVVEFTGRQGSRLAVYRGDTLGQLAVVASGTASQDAVPFVVGRLDAAAGERFALAFEDSAPEWFAQSAVVHPGNRHDAIESAEEFRGVALFSGWPASADPEERQIVPDSAYGVLWHRWTAPADGIYSMEVLRGVGAAARALPLPRLAVFAGESLANLSRVNEQRPATASPRELVVFSAARGQPFRFAVAPGSYQRQNYRLGMTGPSMDEVQPALKMLASSAELVAESDGLREFVHRIDRSADLSNWQPALWFEMTSSHTRFPAPELSSNETAAFFRLLKPD